MSRRSIAVVTGSRAEYGLLRPVIAAMRSRSDLATQVIVTGAHLLGDDPTIAEVERDGPVEARIPMQTGASTGRNADAAALARGCSGFAERFAAERPDIVLVLGDRIEAFAAAATAAVAGIRVAHLHGGDRAVGIADEALRHAITKLAHVHLAATAASVERILGLGEVPATVHLVGSPAMDGIEAMTSLADTEFDALGAPELLVMLHPDDDDDENQWANAERLLRVCAAAGPTLVLEPNHDPGRGGIMEAIEQSGLRRAGHLQRPQFIGLLRRVRALVGNSSAGLIECAALGIPAINIGPRQDGRERAGNTIDIPDWDFGAIDMALERLPAPADDVPRHPYGDGQTGPRVAALLATLDLQVHALKKCNSF